MGPVPRRSCRPAFAIRHRVGPATPNVPDCGDRVPSDLVTYCKTQSEEGRAGGAGAKRARLAAGERAHARVLQRAAAAAPERAVRFWWRACRFGSHVFCNVGVYAHMPRGRFEGRARARVAARSCGAAAAAAVGPAWRRCLKSGQCARTRARPQQPARPRGRPRGAPPHSAARALRRACNAVCVGGWGGVALSLEGGKGRGKGSWAVRVGARVGRRRGVRPASGNGHGRLRAARRPALCAAGRARARAVTAGNTASTRLEKIMGGEGAWPAACLRRSHNDG